MSPYREHADGPEPPRRPLDVESKVCPHGYFLRFQWICKECNPPPPRELSWLDNPLTGRVVAWGLVVIAYVAVAMRLG